MRVKKAFLLPSIVVVAATILAAQRTSAGNSQPVTTTPRTNTPSSTPSANNPSIDTSLPVYLSGKVITGDGSEIPQNVSLVRVCGSSRRTVGYTDGKGRFNVRISGGGPGLGAIGDASDSGRSDGPGTSGPFGGLNQANTPLGGQAAQNLLM